MKTLMVLGMLGLLAVPVAAAASSGAQPAKARPGSLRGDTMRRERQVRIAWGKTPSVPPAPPVRARVQAGPLSGITFAPAASWVDLFGAGGNIRVVLVLENASVRVALKQVFDQAKLSYTVDADVPAEARITVRAGNVQLHTALDLITEAAGVGWTLERKVVSPPVPPDAGNAEGLTRIAASATTTYRIGKTVSRSTALSRVFLDAHGAAPLSIGDNVFPYAVFGREERSTFTCPHCKVQSTLLRVKQQPKCPKCERLYQPGWQFCPADGAKRPAPPVEWRYCPSCGKQVQPEKAREEGDLLESVAPPADPERAVPGALTPDSEPIGFVPRVAPVDAL